jgi:hypothetical protein
MNSTSNLRVTSDQAGVTPVDEVIAWLIEGHRDADIREAIRQKWPDQEPGALQLAAIEHFERAAGCDVAVVHGWALEAYRDLYRRMVKIGDFANAMKAIKELVRLTADVQRFRPEQEEAEEAGAQNAGPAVVCAAAEETIDQTAGSRCELTAATTKAPRRRRRRS